MTCNNCDNPGLLGPFYTNPCSEVTEDHARHIIVHQYVACFKITNEWAIPLPDQLIWVEVPAMVDMLTGSCIWNPDYGYFVVVAFDKVAQKVRLQRKDGDTTAPAGTIIPSCTKFISTPNV